MNNPSGNIAIQWVGNIALPALCTVAIVVCLLQLAWLATTREQSPACPPATISAFAA